MKASNKCTSPITVKGKFKETATSKARCGKCIGCRIHRKQIWTKRLMDEFETQEGAAIFATFTYRDDICPLSLDRQDMTKLLKRLRKKWNIKYYMCGEYGGSTLRPHYHMILYGINYFLCDVYFNELTQTTHSRLLETVWGKGNVAVGICNKKTCGYVANYITVKPDFEKLVNLEKPYTCMSKTIGKEWCLSHRDEIIKQVWYNKYGLKSSKRLVPKTYKKWLEIDAPELNCQDQKIPTTGQKIIRELKAKAKEKGEKWYVYEEKQRLGNEAVNNTLEKYRGKRGKL